LEDKKEKFFHDKIGTFLKKVISNLREYLVKPNGSKDKTTIFARFYRWARYTLSEEWRLLRDLVALFQELAHPLVLRFKLRLTRRSIKNRRKEWIKLLGKEAFENSPVFSRFSDSLKERPSSRKILERIDSLDRLAEKIEEQIMIFEDAHSQQILAGLSSKISEHQLKSRVISLRDGSPFLSLTVDEARVRAQEQGLVMVTALRRGVTLSGRTLLRTDDLIVGIVPSFSNSKEEEAWSIDHNQIHSSMEPDRMF